MRFTVDGFRLARVLIVAAFLAVLVLPAPSLDASTTMRIPGTAISLDPPVGFVPSKSFAGFHRNDSGSTITVTEVARSFNQVRRTMNRDDLGRQGMQLLVITKEMVSGYEARLLYIIQDYQGTVFRRQMLVFGDQYRTYMVIGSYPQAQKERLDEAMRSALLSVRWDPA